MTAPALTVDRGLPGNWDQLAAAAPPSVPRRWIGLAIDRFGPGYRTFTLRAGNLAVLAMGGVVIDTPLPKPRIDPYHILSGRSAHLGLIKNGPHPWRGNSPAEVMPSLLLMYPNYDLFPIGPAAEDEGMVGAFLAELRSWAATQRIASLAFLYISAKGNVLPGVLRDAGAAVIPLTDYCHMDVSWLDFAGYLETLQAKRRVTTRRELRALAERGVELAEGKLDVNDAELLRLRCKLVTKYSGKCDIERERQLFERVAASFAPSEICVTTARKEGKLLGFSLLLQDKEEWTAFLTGADYDDPGFRLSYFATMFYLPVALAPERGIRKINYGIGSWEAKRLRGCACTPLYASALRACPAAE